MPIVPCFTAIRYCQWRLKNDKTEVASWLRTATKEEQGRAMLWWTSIIVHLVGKICIFSWWSLTLLSECPYCTVLVGDSITALAPQVKEHRSVVFCSVELDPREENSCLSGSVEVLTPKSLRSEASLNYLLFLCHRAFFCLARKLASIFTEARNENWQV